MPFAVKYQNVRGNEIDESTIRVGGFNTFLSEMNRFNRQKINKEGHN